MKGDFVWFDLNTVDVKGAVSFYTSLLGWTMDHVQNMDYQMWKAGESTFGGVMALPEQAKAMGVPPHWIGYVDVADVDASVARCAELGGRTLVPATDISGNMGRFAILADSTGASFAVYENRGASPTDGPKPPIAWRELATSDVDAAWRFYEGMFGWRKTEAMDMGPGGSYQMFANGEGAAMGGMFRRPEGMPMSAWAFYFGVTDCKATVEKAKGLEARLVNGPMQVPGGGWAANLVDPQGAHFAVFSM